MKALILTGGVWPCDERVVSLAQECDLILCCDGAAKQARRAGIMPDILVGDMDSISLDDRAYVLEHGASEVCLPREKDKTDMQAACDIAIEQAARDVVIVGGLGGRFDHSMGNIQCLWMLHNEGIDARVVSGGEEAQIVASSLQLGCHNGRTFSLIPLLPKTVVLAMTGVKYPLKCTALHLGRTLGISNVVISKQARLTLQSGLALLIVNLTEV